MSRYTVDQWIAAIAKAIEARDVAAVPALLAAMAVDGHPEEAEDLRRLMLAVANPERTDP